MPNDFETCTTGTRNLVVEQGERLERLEALLDQLERRLRVRGGRLPHPMDDLPRYARELREWIADKRADR